MNENRERESIAAPSTPLTPRSVLFSSDEEYRTASEGGRRESGDWSEMPVSPPLTRNGEWNIAALKGATTWPENAKHEWSELPPSPPLTRTALSRVKARSRSSSRSRVYKRSKSSPPSSRRSTLDSVRSEDLMMACCELGEEDAEEDSSLPESNSCLPTNDDSPLIVDLLDSQVYNNQVKCFHIFRHEKSTLKKIRFLKLNFMRVVFELFSRCKRLEIRPEIRTLKNSFCKN